jgi:hypothetical protein
MLVGGDGGMMQKDQSLPTPVITLLALKATTTRGVTTGHFECLALAPPAPASFQPSSGDFSVNVMYVTGTVTELSVKGSHIVIKGTSVITGIGAGKNVAYTFEADEGGPGTYTVLTTANPEPEKDPLVFRELLLEGSIEIDD